MDRKLQTSSASNYFNSSTSICLCQWNFTLFFAHIQSVNLKTYLRTRVYSRDSHLAKRHQIRGFIFYQKGQAISEDIYAKHPNSQLVISKLSNTF